MHSSHRRLNLFLRWLARVTGLLSVGVIVLFLIGDNGMTSENGLAKVRLFEWFGLLLFPIGLILGLVLAWWREALGAALAAGSVTAFYAYHLLLAGRLPGGPWF